VRETRRARAGFVRRVSLPKTRWQVRRLTDTSSIKDMCTEHLQQTDDVISTYLISHCRINCSLVVSSRASAETRRISRQASARSCFTRLVHTCIYTRRGREHHQNRCWRLNASSVSIFSSFSNPPTTHHHYPSLRLTITTPPNTRIIPTSPSHSSFLYSSSLPICWLLLRPPPSMLPF
jgi:hypothetical protein